jgi:cyclophilin family peptidyl-prolyl cis-trans isomerase
MPVLKLLLATLALACASSALAAEPPRVRLETSLGVIELELDAENAPISTDNFLTYVRDGHYDGLIFHRVIANFMIQGGGFTPDMQKRDTRPPIKNEATNGLRNDRGTIAMARTGVVDSATGQFFINVVDNAFLNHRSTNPREYGYAVFGRVTSGMDVVDRIRAVPTTTVSGMRDFPREPVVITRASVIGETPPEAAPAEEPKKAQ